MAEGRKQSVREDGVTSRYLNSNGAPGMTWRVGRWGEAHSLSGANQEKSVVCLAVFRTGLWFSMRAAAFNEGLEPSFLSQAQRNFLTSRCFSGGIPVQLGFTWQSSSAAKQLVEDFQHLDSVHILSRKQ